MHLKTAFAKKKLLFAVFMFFSFSLSALVNSTPTVYTINIEKLELRETPSPNVTVSSGSAIIPSTFNLSNTAGTYVTIFEGSKKVDIASVSPQSLVDILDEDTFIPPGKYDAIRMTMSQEFDVSAEVIISGTRYRTDSSNGTCDPFAFPATNVGVTTQDDNPATTQTMYIPNGISANTQLNDAGYTRDDAESTIIANFWVEPFSISKSAVLAPNISLTCNVTDSIAFEGTIDTDYPVVVSPNVPSIVFEITQPAATGTTPVN